VEQAAYREALVGDKHAGGDAGLKECQTIDTPGVGVGDDPESNQLTLMLNWAVTFLIIALIAAVFGFGLIASTAMGLAKILFFVFLVLFVVALLLGRRAPRV
jgi:uncharacterized membrane protein YtjA (UPF0391 family)